MKSRQPYWIYFLEIEKGLTGPPNTSGYVDGHRVQNVSLSQTEEVKWPC